MSGNLKDVDRIYWELSQLGSGDERQAYLDRACADNRVLRERVEKLLNAQPKAERFLEHPLDCGLVLDLVAPAATEQPGTKIGPYTLLSQIGEGGMGVVYMAEQREPVRRKVALKVIKPGLDTRAVVARFEAERQALAQMDHPNVAHVLDAGATESGRPFFVMELVDGIPITAFCDDNDLATRERLELFIQVCQAVHHSHQKGIIHRDIKPSNVLVVLRDGVPVPKIIDFGVAKATHQDSTDHSVFTGFGQIVGTPLYMSPEQAESSSQNVDTRSDIYSLGVLLYELLTGVPPFDHDRLSKVSFDEVRRVIREEDPLRPSTRVTTLGQAASTISMHRKSDPVRLRHLLCGELDWIVMKTLEKDRERRYESASAFAADVRRYLNNEPVEACPPKFGYRLRKSIQKHRVAVIASLLVSLALAVGAGIATWQAVQAQYARNVAEGEQKRAEDAERRAVSEASIANAVKEFLEKDLLQQVSSDMKRDEDFASRQNLTVREALDRASLAIETRFGDQPLVDAEIRLAIGESYKSIGEYTAALPHLERAAHLRTVHLGRNHPETLAALRSLAYTYEWIGRVPDTVGLLNEVLQIQTAIFGLDDEQTLAAMNELANAYWLEGRFDKAEELYEYTYASYTALFGPEHPGTLGSLNGLGVTYRDSGRFDEAISILEEVAIEVERREGPNNGSTIFIMHRLAMAYQKAGKLDDADHLLRETLQRVQPNDRGALACIANMKAHLGLNLMKQQQFAAAEPLLRESVAFYEAELPGNWRRFHGVSLLGGSLLGQQQYAAAEPLLLEGYQGMKDREAMIFAGDRLRLTEAADRLAQFYQTSGDFAAAYFWWNEMAGGSDAVESSGR